MSAENDEKSPEEVLFPINQNEQARLDSVKYLLAQDVYRDIEKLLVAGEKRLQKIDADNSLDEYRTHDAILLHGKRGTGKSTILVNLKLYLDHSDLLKNKLLILKPIDPTLLEGHDSLFLNIVVAAIINNTEIKQKLASGGAKADRFHDQLEKLGRALEGVQRQDSQYGLEKLRSFNGSIDLGDHAHRLFEAALTLTGRKIIVMPIDDVDMALQFAFDQIDVVRRYLVSPYVIPIICGDLDLYYEVLWREFSGRLCTKNNGELEIAIARCKQLSQEYLAKVLPLPRRIEVPKLSRYLNGTNVSLADDKDKPLLKFRIFHNWLELLLNGRVNGQAGSSFPFPIQSVRGFAQLISSTAELIPELADILKNLDEQNQVLCSLSPLSVGKILNAKFNRNNGKNNHPAFNASIIVEWQEKLMALFKHHPKGRAAYLVLKANSHFRGEPLNPLKPLFIFETDLFQPKLHDQYPQFHRTESVNCTWRQQLAKKLPETWIENLPNETILDYPLPEIGFVIKESEKIPFSGGVNELVWQLLTFFTHSAPDVRSTVILSGRVFELLIMSLVRDVTSEDIASLIVRPPFHSAEEVISGNALDLTQFGSTTFINPVEGSEIAQLAGDINTWRENNQLHDYMPPHSWLIFKVYKKYFSQFPTTMYAEFKEEDGLAKICAIGNKIFQYIWAVFGGLEKGPNFDLDTIISFREIPGDMEFTESLIYKQNIMPFFDPSQKTSEHGSDESPRAFTVMLRDHPLKELFETNYRKVLEELVTDKVTLGGALQV